MTWIVRTTAMAQDDFDKIVVQSAEHFGAPQALRYAHLIRRAIQEVEAITLPGGATVFGGPEQGIFCEG